MKALTVSHAELGDTGTRHLQSGQCEICSQDDQTKPDYLLIEYMPQGVDSHYQDSSKASCVEGSYPTSTTLKMTNMDGDQQSFDVQLGSVFSVGGPFDANTEFFFSDGSDCTIHTSCSAPLVAGDQIGPFKVLAGSECNIGNFTTVPPSDPLEKQCVICSQDYNIKPHYISHH